MKRGKKELHMENPSSNEDSSSSEDDENAELLTEELEEGFFKVLSHLKKKDSKLYEESVRFFSENTSENGQTEKRSIEEYREWLRGQKEKVKNKKVKEDLEALHDFWTSPTLNKDEKFLRDYILNKKFLEPDDSFNIEEEIKKLSDEERELEEQLTFEHKYNCRFEAPGQQVETKSSPESLNLGDKTNESQEKRKRKRKRKNSLHNNEENSVVENCRSVDEDQAKILPPKKQAKIKKCSETSSGTKISRENIGVMPEREETKSSSENLKSEEKIDGSQKNTDRGSEKGSKARRKKRNRNSLYKNEENPVVDNCNSVDKDQAETLHPKKKAKIKKCSEKIDSSGTEINGARKIKQMNSISRHLQKKNKQGKFKKRHRNMRKKKKMFEKRKN